MTYKIISAIICVNLRFDTLRFYMNKKTLCSIYRRGAYAAYSTRLAKRRKKVRHDSSRIGGQATPGEADY
jgi:hypothetical protein